MPRVQVHTFYKTWAETYEEDMNKLQFHSETQKLGELNIFYLLAQGAGLLADMLTDALSRGGKNDVSKVTFQRTQPQKFALCSAESA